MGRALKYLLRLAVLAVLALVVYAFVAELPPPTRTVEVDLAVPPASGGSAGSAGGAGAPVEEPEAASDDPAAQGETAPE